MAETRKRADYTEEFKRDAVDPVANQGYRCSDVGRCLCVPISSVTR